MTDAHQAHRTRRSMTANELDAFLDSARTCHLATLGAGGSPRIAPLWFVWHDSAIWLNSLRASRRGHQITTDPRVAVSVDDGVEYRELRGVLIQGEAVAIGESPRGDAPHPVLEAVEAAHAAKYTAGRPFSADGRHSWIRVTPLRLTSWDNAAR